MGLRGPGEGRRAPTIGQAGTLHDWEKRRICRILCSRSLTKAGRENWFARGTRTLPEPTGSLRRAPERRGGAACLV